MISKELFIKTMRRLEDLDKKMDKVDNALRELSPDCGGFYLFEPLEIVLDILREMFDDKDDLLSYFIYQLNFLDDLIMGDVVDENNEVVEIKSWGDVYDFIVHNMEERNEQY